MPDFAPRFDAIIAELNAALDTLESVVQHVINTANDPSLRVVMLNNVIVSVISTVEETLRDIFTEYLTILEERCGNSQWLRKELHKANLDCAISLLKGHNKNTDFISAAALLKELSKCLNGEVGFRLLKEQLTYNQGNFRSAQISETAKAAGVLKIWTLICDCDEVENYIGESNIDARVNRLISLWNELFDERDLIVHRVSQASGWSPDKIRRSMEFCSLVVSRVGNCLNGDAIDLVHQYEART